MSDAASDLSARLAALGPAQRALLDRWRGSGQPLSRPRRIPRRNQGNLCPLSLDQERLWFIHQLDPGSRAYNIYTANRLQGPLDVAALTGALAEVVRRNEILRTAFVAREGLPVQDIAPELAVSIPLVDLRRLPAAARAAEADLLANAAVRRPFSLDALPLFRILLLRAAEESYVCAIVFHHIIVDWVSYFLFQRELSELYEAITAGRQASLPAPALQYADFAVWERQWSHAAEVRAQLDYWRRQLEGIPHDLGLPADHPRPAVATGRGARQPLALSEVHASAVRRLARAERLTLFMVFLGLFDALLCRLTGERTILVGSPIDRRGLPELRELMGFLLNHLVFCVRVPGTATFREVLLQVRRVALEAYANQDVPFARLVEELRPERDLSRAPLAQVALLFLNPEQLGAIHFPQVEVSHYSVDGRSSKFDLTLALWDGAGGFAGWLEYSSDLFEKPTVLRLVQSFQTLAGAALDDPDRPLAELALLPEAERHQLLVDWNDTTAAPGARRSVVQRFEAQVDRASGAPAVISGGDAMSYRELDLGANRLARRLRRLGVGPEVAVALCLERSAELVVAALAVLKAGGAYVPLDPAQPLERLAFMAADASARAVLARGGLAAALAGRSLPVLNLDRQAEHIAGEAGDRLVESPDLEQLAYVIYTSGSTGRPKGVEVTHGALANLVAWHLRAYAAGLPDRVAQVCGVAFDAAVWDLWPTLVSGGLVELADEATRALPARLRDWLVEREITAGFVPTPLAEAMLALEWPRRTALRHLLTGGDVLHLHPRPELPFALVNHYGPTENAVVATAGRVKPRQGAGGGGMPAIGRPIAGVEAYLVDRALAPVPMGAVGELCLGGESLARGYRGLPRRTAESFVPHPWSARPGARLYRTGDLVRYRPCGELDFVGRADDQVKIRGFRIEPGEVEAALRSHDGVGEAVVLAREEGPGDRRLIAYVVPRQSGRRAPAGELRAHVAARLPELMVPARFVLLDAMPVTAGGKVDRQALRSLGDAARSPRDQAFTAPRTPVEEVLAGIWSEVLAAGRIGTLDNFFALGGHSLLAAQVLSRLREAFGVDLPLSRLFEAATVRELARSVEAALAAATGPPPPPVRPRVRTGGEALALSFAQAPLWALDRLLPGTPFFNVPVAVRLVGALDAAALRRSVAAIVSRHEILRTTFTAGDRRPLQAIAPAGPVPVAVVDLGGLAGDRRESAAKGLVEGFEQVPFDLGKGPLLRAALLRLGEENHCLALSIHHIVFDAWSMGVLVRELTALYEGFSQGGGSPLPELPIQYADFALWQRAWWQDDVVEAEGAYWREILGAATPPAVPTDFPRPERSTFTMAQRRLDLPPGLSAALASLSRRERVTLFISQLAAFAVALGRHAGLEELWLGTLVANRTQRETEDLIGLFVNTVILRVDLSGQPTWRELLHRLRETVLGAFAHQDLPFELMWHVLERQPGRPPGAPVEIMVIFQNAPLQPLELPGLTVAPWQEADHRDEPAIALTAFDLVLVVGEGPEGLSFLLRYKARLFRAATIDRILLELRDALEEMVEQPQGSVATSRQARPDHAPAGEEPAEAG